MGWKHGDTSVLDSSSETHTHTGECEDRWICSELIRLIFLFGSARDG